MSTPTPTPAMPGRPGPAIDSAVLTAWIDRRRRFRRRMTAALVVGLSLAVAGLAVYWTAFSRHLLAKGALENRGFMVIWDLNLKNLATGGETDVNYGRNGFYADFHGVTPADLESLKALRHLKSLDLSGLDQLRDDDLAVLASLGELEELELNRLERRSVPQGGPGVVLLGDRVLDYVANLKRLKSIGLAGDRITDAGLATLAGLPALELIDLEGTQVTDAGLDALVGLKSLKTFRVAGTAVTPAGIARFNAKRPDVEVTRETYEDIYGTPTP